jgi:isopropylmalate/homocitrate/citramalate synthase
MGKKSGLDNIEIWTKKLGIELNEEEAMDVLQEVKLKSHDLKRVLTEKEFMQIAEKVRSEK